MINTIFATKVGMTSQYDDKRRRLGVTVLKVMPMSVDSLRNTEKHGYMAVRCKVTDTRYKDKFLFREIRTDEVIEPGTEVKLEEVLQIGDEVSVSGITKGKGFASVVKRHHFSGGPRTHGQSDRERAPGSSGSGTTPGRVYKGKRRSGHMGVALSTRSGLKILAIDNEQKLVTVVGSVPGNKRGLIKISKKA